MAQTRSLRTFRSGFVHSRDHVGPPSAMGPILPSAPRSRPCAGLLIGSLGTFPSTGNRARRASFVRSESTAFSRTCQKLSRVASISGWAGPSLVIQLADTHRRLDAQPANARHRANRPVSGRTRSGHRIDQGASGARAYFSVVFRPCCAAPIQRRQVSPLV